MKNLLTSKHQLEPIRQDNQNIKYVNLNNFQICKTFFLYTKNKKEEKPTNPREFKNLMYENNI